MSRSSRQFLLAIDVGNSRYKFGLFPLSRPPVAGETRTLPVCVAAWALPAKAPIPWNQLVAWSESGDGACTAAIIAGANPGGIDAILAGWPHAAWPQAQVVQGPGLLPLRVNLAAPEKVGIDRLLNAVAANVLRAAEQPVIIVDTGTATTVDHVSAAGTFEGGAILPGFQLSASSLHDYTALLPLVPVDELAGKPPDPLGRTTRDAIRSGLYWGQLGAVKELIAQLSAVIAGPPPLILLTGGGAPLLAPRLNPGARLEPHLPLQGLALVAESIG